MQLIFFTAVDGAAGYQRFEAMYCITHQGKLIVVLLDTTPYSLVV
jgi:hypothetical protein